MSYQLKPWIIRSSQHVLQDRWISVRADECVTHDGTLITPYYVLEYPSWVNVIAFDEEDRILLVRQYRHGIARITLETPSGCIDPSDESPSAAAERELFEETGYKAKSFIFAGKLSPNAANQPNDVFTFIAEGLEKAGEPKNDPAERIECCLVDLKTLLELIDNGEFPQSTHIASVFLALRKIGKLRPLL